MYEIKDPFNFDNATFNELYAEAKRLQSELTILENKSLYTEKAFLNRDRQYGQAKEIITALIELNEIDNEEAVKELIQIFDIEILKSVEFTINIEVTGSIEIPMGTELDEYSFSLDSLSYNGDSVNIDHDSVSIECWEFTE